VTRTVREELIVLYMPHKMAPSDIVHPDFNQFLVFLTLHLLSFQNWLCHHFQTRSRSIYKFKNQYEADTSTRQAH